MTRRSYLRHDRYTYQAFAELDVGRQVIKQERESNQQQSHTTHNLRRMPVWAIAPPSPPQSFTENASVPFHRSRLRSKDLDFGQLTHASGTILEASVARRPARKGATKKKANATRKSDQSRKVRNTKEAETSSTLSMLVPPEEGYWCEKGLSFVSSNRPDGLDRTAVAENATTVPQEELDADKNLIGSIKNHATGTSRSKGVGTEQRQSASMATIQATQEVARNIYPQDNLPRESSSLSRCSPLPMLPAVQRREKLPTVVMTRLHDALLNEGIPTPRTHLARKRKHSALFFPARNEDEDENNDKVVLPCSRPHTRRSKHLRVAFSFEPSAEAPAIPQDPPVIVAVQIGDRGDLAKYGGQADSDTESEQIDITQREKRNQSLRISLTPDTQPKYRVKKPGNDKHGARSKIKTYSKRRPLVYAPDFHYALNPAQRLFLSPDPEEVQDPTHYKRKHSASCWPDPGMSNVPKITSGIESQQEERHNHTCVGKSRNGAWPEARLVPGLLSQSSPLEDARRMDRQVLLPFTEAWDVTRSVKMPAWVQDKHEQIRATRRQGQQRVDPTIGVACGQERQPAARLNMTWEDSCRQHIEEQANLMPMEGPIWLMTDSYVKALPRPTPAQGPRDMVPEKKRQTKTQRDINGIPERVLPRIKTIDFDGFKQKYKENQISSRFPVNKLLINATIKAQACISVCPPERSRPV